MFARHAVSALLAFPLLALVVYTPSSARAQEATSALPALDVVLARHVEARGGLARLKSISAIRMTGTVTGPMGEDVPTTIYMKRPDRIRQEVQLEGETLVQAFDGTRGWSVNPLSGRGPVEVPQAVARRMAEQADFDGPLVDPAAKGHKVELVGTDKVDARPAVKLRLIKKSGEQQLVWLDAERWLELKSEATIEQDGRELRIESRNSEFRTVEGVTSPFVVEVLVNGQPQQRIALDRVEFPPSLEDTLFARPSR